MFSFSSCIYSVAIIIVLFLYLANIDFRFYIVSFLGLCFVGFICVYSFSFDRVEVIETIALTSVMEQEELKNTYSIDFRYDIKEPIIEKVKVYGSYDLIYRTDERLVLPYPEDEN